MRKAVKWLLEHAAAALLLDPGLGKTAITLAAITILREEGVLDRALVIAPLRVCHQVWPKEAAKWDDFHGLRVHVLHGKGRTEEALKRRDVDVFVINPEGLDWLLELGCKRFAMLDPDTLVVDESHKFKNARGIRYKALEKYLPKFRRRWILTGSPAPNGLLDLFGQVYIMDLGRSLGAYITHFRNNYFDATGYGGFQWKIRPGAAERIYAKLRDYALRLDADDVMELPPVIPVKLVVELPPKARRAYDEMETQLFALLDEGTKVTATNAAVASGKCRQIAGGALFKNEEGVKVRRAVKADTYVEIHDAKIEALKEFLAERNGKPTIVLYQFRHELHRLLKALGKDTPYIGGGVSAKRSAEIEDLWNAGELPVLLGQPESISHGLNLQESGDALCWFSLTWDWAVFDQMIRRLRRQGQKAKHITNAVIIAEDTIDEVMYAVLQGKRSVERRLLDALNDYRRNKREVKRNERKRTV